MNWLGDGPINLAHPWVLSLLILLPVLGWLRGQRGAAAAVLFSSLQPLRSLGRPRRARAGAILTNLLMLALALFLVALARPRQGRVISQVQASGIDIILAVDVSRSMLAEDFTIGSARRSILSPTSSFRTRSSFGFRTALGEGTRVLIGRI